MSKLEESKNKKRKTHKPWALSKLLMLLPVSCALFYPVYLAAQLDTEEKIYRSSKLPPMFDGFTITYLSDIHYGLLFSQKRVEALVHTVNALQSDIIILGGDYGEDSTGAVDFFSLKPAFSAKSGIFCIMGNHDRTVPDSRIYDVMQGMTACGFTPLVNKCETITRGGSSLALCGIDDFYNGFPDFDVVKQASENANFTIFLPHTPDAIPSCHNAGEKPFFDLALCGHTHGGQVSLFGKALFSSSIYGNRYNSGWIKEDGADVLISNGVGTSGLPIRIGARPQIHHITLRCGTD